MSQKPLHERFTREQVLYALDTTHEDCKHGCPHGPALDDVTVLPAVVRSLLHISDLAIKEGISTEMLAFSEGLHFGLRLAEIENKTFPPDEANLAGKTSHQRAIERAESGIKKPYRPEVPTAERGVEEQLTEAAQRIHQQAEEVAGTERITRDEPDFTIERDETPFDRKEPIRMGASSLESTGTNGN